ncbi:ryncolin-1-like [Crassostrea virginica]
MTTEGGGWTVFQRRIDGTVNFNQDWKSYKEGFGKTEGEYWLGNEALHLLTKASKQELRVDLQKFTGEKAFAKYSIFAVGSGSEKNKLTVGGYRGTAGDSLQTHNGYKFSTKDQDNDIWAKDCVAVYPGGWWFYNCHTCNLNGSYHKYAVQSTKAVTWYQFGKSWVSLKSTRMMIRSKA